MICRPAGTAALFHVALEAVLDDAAAVVLVQSAFSLDLPCGVEGVAATMAAMAALSVFMTHITFKVHVMESVPQSAVLDSLEMSWSSQECRVSQS